MTFEGLAALTFGRGFASICHVGSGVTAACKSPGHWNLKKPPFKAAFSIVNTTPVAILLHCRVPKAGAGAPGTRLAIGLTTVH